MGFTMKSPLAFAQRRRDTRSIAALKPAALLSCCEMNVLVYIFFQNKPVSSALKTCSRRYPFSSMRLTSSAGNALAKSWSTEACSPASLRSYKLYCALKRWNHLLLAVNGLQVLLVPTTLVIAPPAPERWSCRSFVFFHISGLLGGIPF